MWGAGPRHMWVGPPTSQVVRREVREVVGLRREGAGRGQEGLWGTPEEAEGEAGRRCVCGVGGVDARRFLGVVGYVDQETICHVFDVLLLRNEVSVVP